jgi:hypothetical protein
MNRVGDRIDEFIQAELKAHPEQVCQFFERVQLNYDEAIRNATRYLLSMLAAWFVSYAIHKGWIGKVGWLGIDFNHEMIVASPFLIGLLSYGALSSLAGAIVLWEAIIQRLRYIMPTAWEHYLENFLAPPTFSNVERMMEPIIDRSRLSIYFSRSWFVFVTIMMFGGGLAGIAHTTIYSFGPRPGRQPFSGRLSSQVRL